jgi:uncharacterized cofD-like protein
MSQTSTYAESFSPSPEEIVVIGGGTGTSTVVSGLTAKPYSGEGVTAIVNTFDDGGGTGELRRVYKDLPAVGDLRQCFAAMSRLSPGAQRALARRFGAGDISDNLNLKGQTQGNLLIASALQTELGQDGTFSSALEIIGELYQIKGNVVPASDDVRTLSFGLPNGRFIEGEHQAEEAKIKSFMGATISFNKETNISDEAEAAIKSADMVVLAPGDLYTSIGPNLVVQGMREALQEANVVVMIANLMNRDRHTRGFTALDYAREYTRLIGAEVIQRVIVNKEQLNPEALAEQRQDGSSPVRPNIRGLQKEGYTVRSFDLLSHDTVDLDPNDAISDSRSLIRHDPYKVASALFSVYVNNGFAGKSS